MADGKEWTTANLNVNTSSSYCYDDAEPNCRRYGRLYTWESAQRGCQSLGDGWRLPTDDEWRQMAKHYGGLGNDSPDKGKAAYMALLSGGTSGFNAVLGGDRSIDGQYDRLEAHGMYWTASENDPITAPLYNFGKGSQALYRQPQGQKQMAFPCVASGSDRSKFGPARSNRSGTHSTVRSQLLLPSRVVFSDASVRPPSEREAGCSGWRGYRAWSVPHQAHSRTLILLRFSLRRLPSVRSDREVERAAEGENQVKDCSLALSEVDKQRRQS